MRRDSKDPEIIVEHGEGSHFELYTKFREQQRQQDERKRDMRIAQEVEVLDGAGEDYFRLRDEMGSGISGLAVETEEDCPPSELSFEDFCKWRFRTSPSVRRGK